MHEAMQRVFGAVGAVLVAKFMVNDIPHALGLMAQHELEVPPGIPPRVARLVMARIRSKAARLQRTLSPGEIAAEITSAIAGFAPRDSLVLRKTETVSVTIAEEPFVPADARAAKAFSDLYDMAMREEAYVYPPYGRGRGERRRRY